MSANILLIFVIALASLNVIQTAKRRFNIEINSFNCDDFSTPLKHLECSVQKINSNHFDMYVYFLIERQLSKSAEMQAVITVAPLIGNKTLEFLDLKVNICDTLEVTSLPVPVATAILNEVNRVSNERFACPFQLNFGYNITKFRFTNQLFPPYAPILNFNFSLRFFENHQEFAYVLVQGATVPL